MTRELAIESIKNMPQEFTFDELMERLISIKKNEGIQDVRDGRVISHKEMKKRMEEWKEKV